MNLREDFILVITMNFSLHKLCLNSTGKSFSKALILASVNPQIQVQNMLCTKIGLFCSCFDIQNNIFTQHVLNLYFSHAEFLNQ